MNLIKTVLGLALRLVLLLMGLVFLASMLLAALLLLVLWLARALWCKLTGREIAPWNFQFRSRTNWSRFYRAAGQWPRGTGAGAARQGAGEVIDVEAKEAKPAREEPPALH